MAHNTSYKLVYILAVAWIFQAISTIGFDYISKLLYEWTGLLFGQSGNAAKLQQLKKQILDLKTQLGSISAQNQFAKWVKLQRQHDKLVTEYTAKANNVNLHKSMFQMQVSWGLWALFWILQIGFLVSWRSDAMFYMPKTWVGPFSSWLSFPFAPAGSVSVLYWFYACRSFCSRSIKMLVWSRIETKPKSD
ncbi:hypothetical protein BDV3_000566 [Batrachochytrium dendrobatidis]